MGELTLVLGGAASGKSRFALEEAKGVRGPVLFLATWIDRSPLANLTPSPFPLPLEGGEEKGEGVDQEMLAKVARHRTERPSHWETVEGLIDLAPIIRSRGKDFGGILLDCLTLWVAARLSEPEPILLKRAEELAAELKASPSPVWAVSNEVGAGLVPADPAGRRFRELAGKVNQLFARAADRVVLVTAGIPSIIKVYGPGAGLARSGFSRPPARSRSSTRGRGGIPDP
jgi:adenosylcobinamide kinase/adenosylcobinamide-phosphate guanylyltransferase